MRKKRKPFDVRAVNPRYGRAKISDVARALTHPKDPKVRAALEQLRGRSFTEGKLPDEG